ncbi:putative alpha,alpha-trehalose-phosphate synthase (UDP-forming) [Helianthus annuus]|uniref:Alpha,alpha-trehalose-phosphate synthase (UDP-forming) n=1 Tax=Helianthus annuus TaxID=4232 RepID=A0A251TNY1_HELAN|nr:putative alpha,alpha-trehalose-phosphate synthase (UDP-forming) [Helianthus annuus]KAJ0514764.1 putative alpha,alpha-trehalose-phosphate synthase (UDP-forming) [Helianthus annuus]KAJ0523056.1 putative alpha,alpha-trehalose-phosphate synthase (UDP-forming) [Helianthus annuus]KAJ0530918.1 putative alpha,alpha-trehalose-phosphate synthase (UDP-forming) [Helianthus annuus]KAJ0701143.1 putative alpha,alpha-trehalose-phosphate synthase (UDP-forming) [Helianthus annuus]
MQSRSYTNLFELASGNFPVMGRERERRKMMPCIMTVPGSIRELDDDQASSDPDFAYFVRVHFCDIVSKLSNTLVFNLYINSDIAYGDLDLSNIRGDLDVPVYRDFVTDSTDESNTLTVSVGSDLDADNPNAILNCLEILKIINGA